MHEKDKNLHGAVKEGDLEKIKQLLKDGANPNAQDMLGNTALKLAVTSIVETTKVYKNGYVPSSNLKTYAANIDNIRALLDAGANTNLKDNSGRTPLMEAASQNGEITKLLLQRSALPNTQALDGTTALMLAMFFNNHEAVESLIDYKADINQQDSCKKTALIWGARTMNNKCMQKLIDAGADVNIQDQTGRTALIWAVQERNNTHVKALLKVGAKVNIADRVNNTAIDIARNINEPELIEILKEYKVKEDKTDLEEQKEIQKSESLKHKQTITNRQRNFRRFLKR